ncbi:MAG TPA: HD-GYP domain-containing protein [Pseudomonadales bacterium]
MSGGLHNASSLLEVPVRNLQPGMYVAKLDRAWLETPFALQGFYVTTREDVDFVAQHCEYVYVDPRRRAKLANLQKHVGPRRTYREKKSLKDELSTARKDLTNAEEAMAKVFEQLRNGTHLNIDVVRTAVSPLIESVLRNSQALSALIRLRAEGDYLYGHSIAVAVWATILGRHLGMAREQLEILAFGGALLDVGMTQIDDSVYRVPRRLNDDEYRIVRNHVDLGSKLLLETGSIAPEIAQMIASHHERFNGSGYPLGLSGMQIPVFARIAGLVDSYDAMITRRPHAESRSSFEAMQELADAKDQLFQGALVEQFMQAIGLFPTGSMVQLNTGEIGVVVQQNEARRLRPKVAMIVDPDGRRYPSITILDLAKYGADGTDRRDLWIKRELEPGAHGIEPEEFFL